MLTIGITANQCIPGTHDIHWVMESDLSLMIVLMFSQRSRRTQCSCNFQSDSRPHSIPIQGSNVRTEERSGVVSTSLAIQQLET